MWYKFVIFSFLLAALLYTPALAQQYYLGGSIGNGFNNKAFNDVSGSDFKIKESNLAWKIFAGTEWRFLGAEGGFRDFGAVEKTNALGTGTSKTRGWDVFGKGVIKLGFIQGFGKAGFFFSRTKDEFVDISGERILNQTKRNAKFAWGLGAGFSLGRLQLRLEWESMKAYEKNLDLLSIGAAFGFNKNKKGPER